MITSKILVLMILLALLGFDASASNIRNQEADNLISTDHTHLHTLQLTTDTVVERNTTDTLTNKSMSGASNTFTSIPASAISSGTLALANGGTNASLTAVNGGVVYSGASALAVSAAGTAGQYLKSAGAGTPTFSDISLTNVVYVSKNGNDSTCISGAINRPCLTIAGAYAKTTSLSNTNRYVVKVAPGVYNEGTTLAMKGNVYVVGDGGTGFSGNAVTIQTDNGISLATGGSSGHITGESFGLYNVSITDSGGGTGINIAFAAGQSSRTLVLSNTFISDAVTVSSSGTSDTVQMVNTTSPGPTLTSVGPQFNGATFSGDINISTSSGIIQDCYIPGNLLVHAPTGSSSIVVFSSSIAGVDLQDSAIDLFIDAVSIPSGGVTNTGGGTYHFTTSAFAINYLPTTSANWTTALTAIQDTLDLIGSGNFSTQGYQLNTSGSQPTCDSSHRGLVWSIYGASGVADQFQICEKNTSNTYAWITPSVGTGPRSEVWLTGGAGHGSTNTAIRRFTTVAKNVGTDITLAQSSVLGDSFTVNTDGVYSVDYFEGVPSGSSSCGVSVNTTQPATTVALANGVVGWNFNNAGRNTSITLNLSSGDVVRAQDDGGSDNTNTRTAIRVTKISN